MADIALDAPAHPGNDLVLRIGKTLWLSPGFWVNLQKMCEMDVARISSETGFIVPQCARNDGGRSLIPKPADESAADSEA